MSDSGETMNAPPTKAQKCNHSGLPEHLKWASSMEQEFDYTCPRCGARWQKVRRKAMSDNAIFMACSKCGSTFNDQMTKRELLAAILLSGMHVESRINQPDPNKPVGYREFPSVDLLDEAIILADRLVERCKRP